MAGDDQPFLTPAERAFFEALCDLGVRYLVVGMSAALLQGARGEPGVHQIEAALAVLRKLGED